MRISKWVWTAMLLTGASALANAQPLDIIWISNGSSNNIHKIQRSSQSVVMTVTLPTGRPIGVAVEANGDVWVANQSAASIHHVSLGGKVVGTYPAPGRPTGMAIDKNGDIWCAPLTGNLFKFSPSGTLLATITPGGSSILGVGADGMGNIWAGDGTAGKTFKVSGTGALLLTISYSRHRIPVADHQDNIFTTGFAAGDLRKYANDGTVLGTFPTPGATSHQGLAVDRVGDVWMSYQSTGVLKYSNAGKPLGTFMTGGTTAVAVAVDGIGDVWVSNLGTGDVSHFKPDGTRVGIVKVGSGTIPIGDAAGFARAVFVDPFGDVDADGHRNNAEAVAGFNPFDPLSTPCSLVVGGDQKVGGKATLDYVDFGTSAGGKAYVMACSLSNQFSIPIGKKRRIDLLPDGLFVLSLTVPALFQNFIGNLDSSGKATGTILIPGASVLAGTAIHCSALTWDLTAPDGVQCIAPTNTFKIKP